MDLKSGRDSTVIHPFLFPLYFIFCPPGVMKEVVYVEMKGSSFPLGKEEKCSLREAWRKRRDCAWEEEAEGIGEKLGDSTGLLR